MWKFIVLSVNGFLFIDSHLHSLLADFLVASHEWCLRISPPSENYQPFYQALVCGETPKPSLLSTHMRTLGIYHLLVVSGSHLVFIEMLFAPLIRRSGRLQWLIETFVFSLLLIFGLICQLSPPIFRALTNFMIRKMSEEEKLYWRGHHLALISGFVCLVIHPEWVLSLSFLLSWMASLLVSTLSHKDWRSHLLIYLALLPMVYALQPLNPISFLANWLIAPVIGLFMLPACALSYVVTPATELVDILWRWVEASFCFLAREIPFEPATAESSFISHWFYILILHTSIHFVWRERRRRCR